jgi:hypothetical protein
VLVNVTTAVPLQAASPSRAALNVAASTLTHALRLCIADSTLPAGSLLFRHFLRNKSRKSAKICEVGVMQRRRHVGYRRQSGKRLYGAYNAREITSFMISLVPP